MLSCSLWVKQSSRLLFCLCCIADLCLANTGRRNPQSKTTMIIKWIHQKLVQDEVRWNSEKDGNYQSSFIKCIVKAARVNKWDPWFYCGLKRYTLAVLFVEDLPLVHLSLIYSESLCMCRKAFKIWHFFVKRLILNTVELHWISKTMQIYLYGSVLTVMITVMMCTQRFMVLLEKWVSVLWVGLLYIWMS